MKTKLRLLIKTNVLLTLLLCFFGSIVLANPDTDLSAISSDFKYTKKKIIDANFEAQENYRLNLSGSFSSYNIMTWDEDYVGFHVEIVAKSNKEDVAEELLHDIDVKFDNSKINKTIYAKTVINSRRHKNIGLYISYVIMIPHDIYLDINSSYGDVNIDKVTRDFTLDLDFADFTIDSLLAYSNLDINYGDTKIKYATDLDADIAFGDIRIEEINSLNIKIKYGDCKIGNIKTLNADCDFSEFSCSYSESAIVDVNYSDTYFDKVNDVKIKNSFSDVEINHLIKKIDISSNYGDFEINEVDSNFELIDAKSKFADINIHFNENQSMSYDIKATQGSITNKIFKENASRYIKDGNTETAIGNINNGCSNNKLKINIEFGDIKIDF